MTAITFTHAEAAIKAGWRPPSFREYVTEFKPRIYSIPVMKNGGRYVIGTLQDVVNVLNVIKKTAR